MSKLPHLYRPRDWQESIGYRVSTTLRNGKPQCRASVHRLRCGSQQCAKPGHVEIDGVWLCRTHDPAAIAERDRAASERWQAKHEQRMRPHRMQAAFREALQQIADGHNDPRALARAALDAWTTPSPQEPTDER